jgi:chromate transporter
MWWCDGNGLRRPNFLGVAICVMLPGPASTQVGIDTGYLCAGWGIGGGYLLVAPAFLIVRALSWAYVRFQGVPQVK